MPTTAPAIISLSNSAGTTESFASSRSREERALEKLLCLLMCVSGTYTNIIERKRSYSGLCPLSQPLVDSVTIIWEKTEKVVHTLVHISAMASPQILAWMPQFISKLEQVLKFINAESKRWSIERWLFYGRMVTRSLQLRAQLSTLEMLLENILLSQEELRRNQQPLLDNNLTQAGGPSSFENSNNVTFSNTHLFSISGHFYGSRRYFRNNTFNIYLDPNSQSVQTVRIV
ncbi:hypothetical protein BDQ12DRAFT_728032 [Crucibulum laeve]|uniref:Uncharacterized protein n=1 Tax=Crucibulum laeve TaxID=68775 RepID=A0A5C3LMH3_9AGAR|nr:hypothetical protein BDQ12DRAFT_728032 [Crucibulum laeve]